MFQPTPAKKRLRFGLLNARSLNTGKDELYVSILNNAPDILALNETWLKSGEEELAPPFPHYKFLHRARRGKRGGGVGFYVKQGITTRVRQHPPSALEQMWLEVQLPTVKIAFGTAYRPESVAVVEALDSLGESLNSLAHCDFACIVGDLNIDVARSDSPKVREFLDFCHHHSLEQLVKEPTRITETSQTIIDLVLTDNPLKCKNVKVIHNHCLSDHAIIFIDFDIKKPKIPKQIRFQRLLHKIDIDAFTKDLNCIPWDFIITLDSVDSMVETFNDFIMTLFDMHAPIRKLTIRDKPKPWITDMIKFMMSLRDEALIKAQKDKKDSSKEYYRDLKNFVTASREREKKAYFNTFINKNKDKPAVLWNNIKNTININAKCVNTLPDHLNDPERINEHFLTLPPDIDTYQVLNTSMINEPPVEELLELKPTTEREVRKIILNIGTKASGLDNLNIEMVKLSLDATLSVITNIINKSIETNTFPSSWKKALVKPIPKKNSVTEMKDLRPISILPVLSKVLEKVVLNQVLQFVEDRNIIPKLQSGFRRGYSTETALLHVTDDLTAASDMGQSSFMVLLDYSRAFDCLHPKLLLAKLKHYGFSVNTCAWFKTFLTDRKQMVVTEAITGEKRFSSLRTLERGVPQGSLLSPLLFTIFTADIRHHIKYSKYHLYADDTQLYYSFDSEDTPEAVNRVNEDLNNIKIWSQNNGLVINPTKSQMLVLGTKLQIKRVLNEEPQIKIDNVVLERVTSARNLGLLIDGEQKYVEHVNSKIRTAFFKLKTLYKIRSYISEQLRVLLCDALVLSQFNYCSSVYGPRLSAGTERAIQRVQNACVRFCYHIPRRDCITPHLNCKGILNMSGRRELHYACAVQRVIWNKKPEYLFEKLLWVKDSTQRSLRQNLENHLKIPPHKSRRYTGCFRFSAAKIWNDLPPPLKRKMGTETFKAKYKLALMKKQLAAENLNFAHWKLLDPRKYF